MTVIAEFEKPTKCEDCPCFYKTEGAYKDICQLTYKEIENYFIIDKSCPLSGTAFKDGAEFGYNKAKEEMQEQGLALQSDMNKTIEQNIQLKKQIEKMKSCSNCIHYSSTFGLCHYSMGDEDYDCRGRKWEIKEND